MNNIYIYISLSLSLSPPLSFCLSVYLSIYLYLIYLDLSIQSILSDLSGLPDLSYLSGRPHRSDLSALLYLLYLSYMEFRASWFSENSDRGIAISVSILSSGFSDALFVCFWWLVTLERLLAICIRTFLILQVLNLKPPTWTSRIRIFWLWSEFSDCYPKKCKS